MFDFGFWELIIVGIVALLVVGPERLPGLARQIGRWVGKIRRFVTTVKSDIEQELRTDELKKMLEDQEREIGRLKTMMESTEEEIRQEVDKTTESVKLMEAELRQNGPAADFPKPTQAQSSEPPPASKSKPKTKSSQSKPTKTAKSAAKAVKAKNVD